MSQREQPRAQKGTGISFRESFPNEKLETCAQLDSELLWVIDNCMASISSYLKRTIYYSFRMPGSPLNILCMLRGWGVADHRSL